MGKNKTNDSNLLFAASFWRNRLRGVSQCVCVCVCVLEKSFFFPFFLFFWQVMWCYTAPRESELSSDYFNTAALMEEIDYRWLVMDVFVGVKIIGCNICHHCINSYERHQSQQYKCVICLFQDVPKSNERPEETETLLCYKCKFSHLCRDSYCCIQS